jgi:hypothetical protein
MWIFAVGMFGVSNGLRLHSQVWQIGFQDTSNCTWSNFTQCALETKTRCAKYKTLELVPIDNQTDDNYFGKIPCHGQAGQRQYETCSDELCPAWVVGNWTDCSMTCNQTLPPWQGIHSRDVTCVDSAGVSYTRDVCQQLYGSALSPPAEEPCECSHQPPTASPYAITYGVVSF